MVPTTLDNDQIVAFSRVCEDIVVSHRNPKPTNQNPPFRRGALYGSDKSKSKTTTSKNVDFLPIPPSSRRHSGPPAAPNSEQTNLSSQESFQYANNETETRTVLTFKETLIIYYKNLMGYLEPESDTDEQTSGSSSSKLMDNKTSTNIRRIRTEIKPYHNLVSNINFARSWQNPILTLNFMLIYFFLVFYEKVIVALLLTLLVFVLLSYSAKKRNVAFTLFDSQVAISSIPKTDSNPFDMFKNARVGLAKVLDWVEKGADGLEKTNNFFACEDEAGTQRLILVLSILICLFSFFPTGTAQQIVLYYFGYLFFVEQPLFKKYPRLRKRFSFLYKLRNRLPTHEQKLQRKAMNGVVTNNATLPTPQSPKMKPTVRKVLQTYKIVEPLLGKFLDGVPCLYSKKKYLKTDKPIHGVVYATDKCFIFRSTKIRLVKESFCIKFNSVLKTQYAEGSLIVGKGRTNSISVDIFFNNEVYVLVFQLMSSKTEDFINWLKNKLPPAEEEPPKLKLPEPNYATSSPRLLRRETSLDIINKMRQQGRMHIPPEEANNSGYIDSGNEDNESDVSSDSDYWREILDEIQS